MEMEGKRRMKGDNKNQQVPPPVPWKSSGGGGMAMPKNSGGCVSIEGKAIDNIQGQGQQGVNFHYPAPHLNPNFYHHYHQQQPCHQPQQQQQLQYGMSPSTFGGGEGGWPSIYYPAQSTGHYPTHGFNGYYVQAPAQHYAVGGPPPLYYPNPFGMNGNPSVSAATPYAPIPTALPQYVPLPSYPNPFQTHPLQCQARPASSNFPDSGQVRPGEVHNLHPSVPSASTSSPRIWRPISSPPIAQTTPALTRSTDASAMPNQAQFGVKAKIRIFGKRRGGSKALPTGVIKRTKESPNVTGTGAQGKAGPGAKSRYMSEVEQYQRQTCSDDKPVRSLMK